MLVFSMTTPAALLAATLFIVRQATAAERSPKCPLHTCCMQQEYSIRLFGSKKTGRVAMRMFGATSEAGVERSCQVLPCASRSVKAHRQVYNQQGSKEATNLPSPKDHLGR